MQNSLMKYWKRNTEYFNDKIEANKDNRAILEKIMERINTFYNMGALSPRAFKSLIVKIGECYCDIHLEQSRRIKQNANNNNNGNTTNNNIYNF